MRLMKSTCPRVQTLLLRNPTKTRHGESFGKVYHDPIHHGFKAVSQRAPTFRSWGALSVRCFRNRLIRSIIDWYLKGIAWKTFKYLEQVLGYELWPVRYELCPDPQQQETVIGEHKPPELISKQSVKMPTKSISVITKRNKQKPISKRKAQ